MGEAASFPITMAEPPRLSEILLPDDKVIIYFVQRSEDWPYYLDFINDEKLTASPTESEIA